MTIKAPPIPARTGRTLKWARVKTARRIEGNQSLIYGLAVPALRNRRMASFADAAFEAARCRELTRLRGPTGLPTRPSRRKF